LRSSAPRTSPVPLSAFALALAIVLFAGARPSACLVPASGAFHNPGQIKDAPGFGGPAALLNLVKYLPGRPDLQGWAPKGKPQIYKGEDLFLYIDGGAEIFHEYGFRQVITQDYANPAGKTITLDIFEMATSECAYGMYSFKIGAKGKSLPLGQDAALEDYYLNFWKGRCLITITGPDGGPDSLNGVERIGRAVDAKIGLEGPRPALPGVLPKTWAGAGRTVYVRGILGLQNIFTFFSRDVFLFKEGVISDQGMLKVFVLRYGNPDEGRKRFAAVKDAFRKASAYRNFQELSGGIFEVADAKGNAIFGAAFEDCLGLIVNRGSQRAAADIFDMLKSGRAALPASSGTRR
jgi:hypothetical protein